MGDHAVDDDDAWECVCCTLRNVSTNGTCAACDEPKPDVDVATVFPVDDRGSVDDFGQSPWASEDELEDFERRQLEMAVQMSLGQEEYDTPTGSRGSKHKRRRVSSSLRAELDELLDDPVSTRWATSAMAGRTRSGRALTDRRSEEIDVDGNSSVEVDSGHRRPGRGQSQPVVLTEDELKALREHRLQQLVAQSTHILAKIKEGICQLGRMADGAVASPDVAPATAALPLALPSVPLRDYQEQGVRWLISMHRASLNGILADEMGLGKTLQVIAFLACLAEAGAVRGPHLVVAPLSAMTTWSAEVQRFLPALASRVHLYRGKRDERVCNYHAFMQTTGKEYTDRYHSFALVIASYDLVIRDLSILKRRKWSYLIVDEGHRLKNVRSKLKAALGALTTSRRLLLTGTPLQNDISELWSLLNFCLPSLFDSLSSFEEWFSAPFVNTVVIARMMNADSGRMGLLQTEMAAGHQLALTPEERQLIISRLHDVLRPFLLRRTKADVAIELPGKTEQIVLCPMSQLQATLYNQIRAGIREYFDDKTGLRQTVSIANMLMRLRQICNHPYLLRKEWVADDELLDASGKFRVLRALLPKLNYAGHRTLVFSQMTMLLDLLEPLLDILGLPFLRLDGRVKSCDRDSILNAFNAPDCPARLLLISTRAGNVGINLQVADTVILFDTDFNPQQDLQAQARAHRLGQTREVKVIRLLSRGPRLCKADTHCIKSVDELIYLRAQRKFTNEQEIITNGRFHHGYENESPSSSGGALQLDAAANSYKTLLTKCLSDDATDSMLHSDQLPDSSDVVSVADINRLCSRDVGDLKLFEQWDSCQTLS